MKVHILSIAAAGGTLICSSAHAAYLGLALEVANDFFANHPNSAVKAAWNAGPNNQYYIIRLYANFDNNTAADRVNAVAGTSTSPLSVTVVGGTFFNHLGTHGTAYNVPSVSPVQRAWDTWVTIGNAATPGALILTPGFDVQTNNLGGNTSTIGPATNVAWTITPNDAQGQAVSGAPGQAFAPPGTYRVLLAQFTVTNTAVDLQGTALVNVNGQNFENQTFGFAIPGPGALALLGVAGLVGVRRRRA